MDANGPFRLYEITTRTISQQVHASLVRNTLCRKAATLCCSWPGSSVLGAVVWGVAPAAPQ
eukprot:11170173-Lingulodinium_polyedra.AAC.1